MVKIKTVYDRIEHYFGNHEHHFSNRYIFQHNWESDFFCISKTGYCVEVEVKMSKSDFKADFLKPKHKILNALMDDTGIIVKQGREMADRSCRVDFIDPTKMNAPNKFWFACPDGIIDIKDVPKYAGLINITEVSKNYYSLKIIKNAPFIHKRVLNQQSLLFDKYVYSNISLKRLTSSLEYALERICNLKGIEKTDYIRY